MDSIVEQLIYIVSHIIINTYCITFCNNLLENHTSITEHKNVLAIITMTISSLIINTFCPRPLKIFISTFAMIGIIYFLVEKNMKKSLSIFIMLQISIVISEVIYTGIISIFGINYAEIIPESFSNIVVSLLGFILLKLKIPNRVFSFISNIIIYMRQKEIIVYSLMVILILIVSTIESYMDLSLTIMLITNSLMAIIFITIVIKFVTAKNSYQEISNKYQTSISSLREHETMIDKFRVSGHENKNELMTIRNMSKEEKVINYIDKLIDNKIKDNETIMNKTAKIPEGGLRATIYTKLCVMEKYNIKYTLDISNNLKTVDLINIDESIIINICKVLGVFLDNAIEEVIKHKKRNISIELFLLDNDLYIEITNNFNGNLDIEKMSNTKYTTKGKTHGYGLLLVNDIIGKSSGKLKNEKRIEGNYFTQSLIIKGL